MALFTKETLETLRERIDLISVLEPHLDLKRSGASYKACCPFHEEKSPSFIVKRGDSHYHCFGCGAHGDAIAFLMNHLKLTFEDSVEQLAERFGVHLQKSEAEEPQGPSKKLLKEANEEACAFFHDYLLHTEEGHRALDYLYRRGLDLDFIRSFRIGYAPSESKLFTKALQKQRAVLEEAGLVQRGESRPFFQERVMFPILDAAGSVIGFSGRKISEDTYGPKYKNTAETLLFKKSKVLFGLHQSRKRIAKEKRVIICEGQIDALRLIQEGFNFAVAGQGTAFGQEQAQELIKLGINHAILALDGDDAGRDAAVKIGHFFQKEGIDVSVAILPNGSDPDTFLRTEGPPAFSKLIEESKDYLSYLVDYYSQGQDLSRPAVKTDIVQMISRRILDWNHPLMVHESLRKLARLTHVPESTIEAEKYRPADVIVKRVGTLSQTHIDPDRILETDLLRWLLTVGQNQPEMVELICYNIKREHFQTPVCRDLFVHIIEQFDKGKSCDLLELSISIDNAEEQFFLSEVLQKRINRDRAKAGIEETIKRILERHWLTKREEIKSKIHSGTCTEEEILELAKQFDELKSHPPKVISPTCHPILE